MASTPEDAVNPAEKRHRCDSNPVSQFFSHDKLLDVSRCLVNPPCRKQKVAGRHSGNLEKHLRVHHAEMYEKFQKEKGERSVKKKAVEIVNKINGVELSASQIIRCCLRMVTAHGRALALIDDDAFQGIVQPIVNALPVRDRFAVSSRAVAARIPAFADKVRNVITEEIQGRLVFLKVDGVTRNNRHFIGINIQYINGGKITIRTLSVREMFSRHTGLNIKSEVLSTLDAFGISVQNILTSTFDTGANMIKMAELLKNAQIEDADDFGITEWFPQCQLEYYDALLQTVKCAAHTLQLAVQDATKNSATTVDIMNRARDAACALRTPNQEIKLRKEGYAMPVLDFTTRWGSSFDMAKSVNDLKDCAMSNESDDCRLCLTDDQWHSLEEAIEALRPAREATTNLQDSQLLLGDLYSLWIKCKYSTAKIGPTLAKLIVQNMESRKKARVNKKGEETLPSLFQYPGFKAAIFLDPRFMSVLTKEDVDDAKAYLKLVWKKLQAAKGEAEAPFVSDRNYSISGDNADAGSEDEEDEFSVFIKAKNEERVESEATTGAKIDTLLSVYAKTTKSLPLKSIVLEYWETQRLAQPELYALATTVLAIPATQVSVERLFSSLAFILGPLRNNLDSQRVDDILRLHANDDIAKMTPVVEVEMDMSMSRSSSALSSSSTSSERSPFILS